ncbi:IclR family transcriptional regulator [Streptomyces sp. NPDC059477]|uniref:IclR family transcriptional regulator n=1 Tax=Streptomyces sp. NPDC059477 TaxID=3346847 RepID=UPI00368068B8
MARERRTDEVAVLLKALDILNCLAVDAPCTAAHISEHAGVTKPAAYRILKTLDLSGYVVRDEEQREYMLGPALHGLSRAARSSSDLVRVARPVMETLNEELGETVNLGVLSHGQIVYLDTIESTHRLRSTVQIALRDCVHSTALGKAILAALPVEEARKRLEGADLTAMTSHTLTEVPALLSQLEGVREMGYAVDDEENELGSRCVATAILDGSAKPVAALSVSAPTTRMRAETLQRVGRRVAGAAADLGELIR